MKLKVKATRKKYENDWYWLPVLEVAETNQKYFGDSPCPSLTKKDALKHAEWAKMESILVGYVINF